MAPPLHPLLDTAGIFIAASAANASGLDGSGVSVGIAAFALSTLFAVFAAAGFVVGLAAAPAFVLSETLLQEGTEPRQRGRVFSARDFLMRLVFVLGGRQSGHSSLLVTRKKLPPLRHSCAIPIP